MVLFLSIIEIALRKDSRQIGSIPWSTMAENEFWTHCSWLTSQGLQYQAITVSRYWRLHLPGVGWSKISIKSSIWPVLGVVGGDLLPIQPKDQLMCYGFRFGYIRKHMAADCGEKGFRVGICGDRTSPRVKAFMALPWDGRCHLSINYRTRIASENFVRRMTFFPICGWKPGQILGRCCCSNVAFDV